MTRKKLHYSPERLHLFALHRLLGTRRLMARPRKVGHGQDWGLEALVAFFSCNLQYYRQHALLYHINDFEHMACLDLSSGHIINFMYANG